MTAGIIQLRQILAGRLARNLYFWALLVYTRLDFSYNVRQAVYTAILFVLLMLLFYTNNLRLIPFYLAKKRYSRYFLFYTLLCAGVSCLYVTTLKAALLFNPGYSVGMISPLVMGGETSEFTLAAFTTQWLPYFAGLFPVGCVFAMSWYVMDYHRQQKLIEETRKQHLELELGFLKNQINPHFLFNSLNNLYALTMKKSDMAPEVVAKISAILRYLLYESDTKTVSFEKEKEIMKAYIDLELLRLSDTSHLQFSITSDRNYSVPPLLWLPLLENVFKHGTGFIGQVPRIDFKLSIENELLQIHSCNTFKPGLTGKEGIGLNNLKHRLRLLFGDDCKLAVSKEGDQFTADLRINLKSA